MAEAILSKTNTQIQESAQRNQKTASQMMREIIPFNNDFSSMATRRRRVSRLGKMSLKSIFAVGERK